MLSWIHPLYILINHIKYMAEAFQEHPVKSQSFPNSTFYIFVIFWIKRGQKLPEGEFYDFIQLCIIRIKC